MSRRFATLADLMTGRGGVHEVSAARLVAIAVADLSGIDRLSSDGAEDDSGDAGEDRDAFESTARHFESHVEYVLPSISSGGQTRSLHVLRLIPDVEANLMAELLRRV